MYFYIPPYEAQRAQRYRRVRTIIIATLSIIFLVTVLGIFILWNGEPPVITIGKPQNQNSIVTRSTPFPSLPNGDIPGRVGPLTEKLRVLSSLTISQNGAVIEGIDVTGEIRVSAHNVTIKNFRANNIFIDNSYTGLVVEDGELHGETNPHASGIVSANYVARRLNVHGLEDGFKAQGNVTIENCWIHDLAFFQTPQGISHNDGVQISSGQSITVSQSRFENIKGTASIFIKPDQGYISVVTISNNILGGGAYTVSIQGTDTFGSPTQISLVQNTFLDEYIYGSINIEVPGIFLQGNTNSHGGLLHDQYSS